MYSNNVLKRFVKDYKLPIQVIQEPYFTYFMELYDKQHNTREKFQLLEKAISKFKTEEDFLHEYYEIRDKIIKSIEGTEVYNEYNNMKMDKYNVPNNNYPKNDIFNKSNVGKYFMSIDLKKANFQAMKWLNKDLVLNCETYAELIGRFTDMEYMKESKYLRQVIFGNMNPKRQVKIERYMTEQIVNLLFMSSNFTKEDVRMVSNDEIIFEVTREYANNATPECLVDRIKQNLGFDVDIEIYRLDNIGNTKYFSKEFINKEGYELMCIPLVYHAQVFKKYNNMDIVDNDLVFFYENQVCKFMKPINFESEVETDECNRDEE